MSLYSCSALRRNFWVKSCINDAIPVSFAFLVISSFIHFMLVGCPVSLCAYQNLYPGLCSFEMHGTCLLTYLVSVLPGSELHRDD